MSGGRKEMYVYKAFRIVEHGQKPVLECRRCGKRYRGWTAAKMHIRECWGILLKEEEK